MNVLIEIVVLLAIFGQYIVSLYAIINKKFNLFAAVYLASLFFYDWLFINAYYFLPPLLLAVLKPYNEYLFLILLFRFIVSTVQHKKSKNALADSIILALIVPSFIVLCANDLSRNLNLSDTISGIRIYLLPILTPYLMYKAKWFNSLNTKKILSFLFTISIISVIYGFFQRQGFNGSVRSLWFYNFFNQYTENLVEIGPYNFIRNDVLRTTSFFVSPIIFSISLAIPTIYVLELLISKNKLFSRKYLLFVLVILCYGLLICETRVGIIVSIISIAIHLVPKFFKFKYAYRIMLFVPFLAMILTFLSLIFGYTDDLSALGRLTQYASFFEYFQPLGLGFNNEYVLTRFDTYYMSVGLVYGGLLIFPVWFYLRINKFLYKVVLLNIDSPDFLFLKSTLALSLTFIYSFAFQFTAGAYQYRVMFFLIFIALTYQKNDN